MFKFRPARHKISKAASFVGFEPLENRQLLSASMAGFGGKHGGGNFGGAPGGMGPGNGGILSAITFDQAPAAVQTGLDSLATADGLSDPAAADKVLLGNSGGVETYSVTLTSTGTVSHLTVVSAGTPVTAPTHTTTTFGDLTTTDSAATTEITAIATALSLTAPTTTTTIDVLTTSAGAVTYSIHLSSSTDDTTTTSTTSAADYKGAHDRVITVDSDGNPVGNAQLPFSVLPTAIQKALNDNAPTGATAYAADSTQTVSVQTVDGVTTYSVAFTISGTTSVITVNLTGSLVDLPTSTTANYSTLPAAAKTELQTLATAYGVTDTISDTQSVTAVTELTGETIYSVKLSATTTGLDGNTFTRDLTITVDAEGNPTTPDQLLRGDKGISGSATDGTTSADPTSGTVDCTPTTGTTTSTGSTSSGTTDSGSSSSTTSGNTAAAIVATTTGGGVGSAVGGFGTSKVAFSLLSSAAKAATDGNQALSALIVSSLGIIAPKSANAAVQADLSTLAADQKALFADVRALSATDRATYQNDLKAVNAAIKAMSSTLSPLAATLKSDTATWKKTLMSDMAAIRSDKNDATALATDQATLASDQAKAFAAIFADQSAIQAAIDADASVITAKAQLASDLPTINTAQDKIKSDYTQLQKDIAAQLA